MKNLAGWVIGFAALTAPLAHADELGSLGLTSLPGALAISIPANTNPDDFFGPGPRTITEGITWSSSADYSLFGYTGGHGIGSNGGWSGLPMMALNSGTGAMTIAFASPVSGVAAFMNYAPGMGDIPAISVYDSSEQLLESYVLNYPVGSEFDSNVGEVHGFLRPNADIAYFSLAGSFIVARSLQVTPVPEPESFAMLLAGLGLIAAVVRSRRGGRA